MIYNQALSIVGTSCDVGEVLHLVDAQSEVSGIRSSSRKAMRLAAAAGLTACMGVLAGCGNSYRPVLATIGVVGPAGQPTKYAVAVSSSSPTSNGLMTLVDFSGDSVLVTATVGVNPYYLVLNSSGTTGYTLNSDKTVTSFDISNQLISSEVLESTLPAGSNPVSLASLTSSTYISDPGVNAIDQLVGSPAALKQELPVATAYSPLYVVGIANAARAYAITPAAGGCPTTGTVAAGQVQAIEIGVNTISASLPVGRCPVYGVMSVDGLRAFILNQRDGTVSVINTQQNALDAVASPYTNPIPVGTNPVWADLASGLDELVVANAGSGTTPGSVTIVNIPLCSVSALPNNPNCDPNNPIDAAAFGQVEANVPVGINPVMVSVLSDFTRAYVANAGQANLPCAANGVAVPGVSTTCTVSVVNLQTNTVTATIPIAGHPAYITTSAATPTGKVYVVCKDSQVMTVIKTNTDTVDTTIPLQGYGVSVRMTQP